MEDKFNFGDWLVSLGYAFFDNVCYLYECDEFTSYFVIFENPENHEKPMSHATTAYLNEAYLQIPETKAEAETLLKLLGITL